MTGTDGAAAPDGFVIHYRLSIKDICFPPNVSLEPVLAGFCILERSQGLDSIRAAVARSKMTSHQAVYVEIATSRFLILFS